MLTFITGNANKFAEAKAILGELEQLDINLPEIQSLDSREIIKAKLQEALKHHAGHFIVEDTSLSLECLKGLPGPLIKWFLETVGSDGLSEIAIRADNQKARAAVTIGYASSPDSIHFFEGSVAGTIVAPRGDSKFGWDVIFQPEGHERAYGEMQKEEKNQISPRRLALDGLRAFLEKNETA